MVSRAYAACLCCVFLGASRFAQTAYLRPLQQEEISADTTSQVDSPGMALVALCWDGQNLITECHSRSRLIKQALFKLLRSLETQTRQRAQEVYTDKQINGNLGNAAKRTGDNASGFYSNW